MLSAARLTARTAACISRSTRPTAQWAQQRHVTLHRVAPVTSTRLLHSQPRCRHGDHDHKPSAAAVTPAVSSSSPSSSSSASAVAASGAASTASPPAVQSLPEMARGLLGQFRLIVHHYKLGAKLLWSNLKRARAISRRLAAAGAVGTPERAMAQSYSDALHLHRFRTDLLLGVPFVFFGALPVVGNLAPVFAWLCPRYIPATFHFPSQTLQHLRLDGRSARALLASLRQIYSFHPHSCGLDKLRGLIERVEKGVGRFDRVDSLQPLAALFQELTPSLSGYTRHHLLLVHRSLAHSGFVPKYAYTRGMLVRSLERWAERVWSEDQLLTRPGAVAALSAPELVTALYDRGLYRQPILMASVLARAQREALDAVDGDRARAIAAGKDLPPPTFLPALPPPPSETLVAEWREALEQWVTMHAALRKQAQANADAPSASSSADASAATPSTPAAPAAPTFPLSFLVHAGPIGRIASSQADIAAVPPLDA